MSDKTVSDGHDQESDCLFCRWVRTGRALARRGSVVAFKDGYPVTDGHLLILPVRHVSDCLSMTRDEIRDSEVLIRSLTATIRQNDPTVSGFNLGTNVGESAGQTVMHAHIHLIPRRDGDTPDPRGGVRGVIPGKRSY
jgi:diadenosine tetraphosphate (Ap4A) HIT family hydrolase